MAYDYAKAYQTFIDEELCAPSSTSWMEVNAERLRYEGGKDVQISELYMSTGLGTYDSSKTDGTSYPDPFLATQKWRSYSLFMDRAAQLVINTEPSDTGFIATAENVIRVMMRTKVVPEMDMYRIAKIYNTVANGAHSLTNKITGTITSANAIAELAKTINAVQKTSEQAGGFVGIVSLDLYGAFVEAAATNNAIKFVDKAIIKGKEYKGVMYFGNTPCLFVPQERMVTDVKILSGRDSETDGGIVADEDAKNINFVVALEDAPFAVTKIDSVKHFPPEVNQTFDGTLIQMRYLYDCFVPKQQIAGVAVHIEA